jgi:hypothetical protein
MYIYLHIQNTEVLVESSLLLISAMLYYILALFGNWIDFNFRSSLDISVYIQCKPKDVQSLQSSYFLVFYHLGFETTTLTFSRIIDFDDATNLFLKQVYSCAVVDACLIWTDLIILISRPVRWDKCYQSTHFKGKLHNLPIIDNNKLSCIL